MTAVAFQALMEKNYHTNVLNREGGKKAKGISLCVMSGHDEKGSRGIGRDQHCAWSGIGLTLER